MAPLIETNERFGLVFLLICVTENTIFTTKVACYKLAVTKLYMLHFFFIDRTVIKSVFFCYRIQLFHTVEDKPVRHYFIRACKLVQLFDQIIFLLIDIF